MYGGKTVTVVLPAYNEAPYIRAAVEDFFVPGVVDEVVVVDNNSRDGTAEQAAADACAGRPRVRAGVRTRACGAGCEKPRVTSSSSPSRTARSSAATC